MLFWLIIMLFIITIFSIAEETGGFSLIVGLIGLIGIFIGTFEFMGQPINPNSLSRDIYKCESLINKDNKVLLIVTGISNNSTYLVEEKKSLIQSKFYKLSNDGESLLPYSFEE